MDAPPRLIPLLEQFDFGTQQLIERLEGLTDDEYFWQPVPNCWTIHRRSDGPGPGAVDVVGSGEWGRDYAYPAPEPPPFTTLAWRLNHLAESITLRADHTIGTHALTRGEYRNSGTADKAIAAFVKATTAWRDALTTANDAALDQIGRSTYPNGSDPEDVFLYTVWWVNEEILHHGAEIGLLRDLYRDIHR